MRFSTEIVRGVRLAAILIAVGLVGVTLYRMLDLVDDDDTASASSPHSVAAAAPAKPLKSSGPKFYPPPPPPLPGRAAIAKPVQRQGRDILVVDVPAARDSSPLVTADVTPPVLEPRLDPVAQAAVSEPLADVPAAPAPHRNNRFVRAFHRVVRIVKPN
jgi:hypothetical protein